MPGPGAFLVGEEERKHVAEVMETGYLSRYGSESDPRFKHKVVTLERLFAERSGVRHALAVNGGTGAIMASLVALGVGPGVEVLVPGYTFVASISAVLAVGFTGRYESSGDRHHKENLDHLTAACRLLPGSVRLNSSPASLSNSIASCSSVMLDSGARYSTMPTPAKVAAISSPPMLPVPIET